MNEGTSTGFVRNYSEADLSFTQVLSLPRVLTHVSEMVEKLSAEKVYSNVPRHLILEGEMVVEREEDGSLGGGDSNVLRHLNDDFTVAAKDRKIDIKGKGRKS